MFFQNPFTFDYKGLWLLGDRKMTLPFECPSNKGRGPKLVVAWAEGPYNLSGNDANGKSTANLSLKFATNENNFINWATITIDITAGAGNTAAVTPNEIVDALNADGVFASYFTASLQKFPSGSNRVTIEQKWPELRLRFYVVNGTAESVLLFNKKAGVAELPTYFARHTASNARNFEDSTNCLIQLSYLITAITVASPAVITSTAHGLIDNDIIDIVRSNSNAVIDGISLTVDQVSADTFKAGQNVAVTAGTRGIWATAVDADIIANAVDAKGISLGYTLAGTHFDWELLEGRSGIFQCQKHTIDNNLVVQTIEYSTGAQAGDLAKKILYTYSGSIVATKMELPYTLLASDLLVATTP